MGTMTDEFKKKYLEPSLERSLTEIRKDLIQISKEETSSAELYGYIKKNFSNTPDKNVIKYFCIVGGLSEQEITGLILKRFEEVYDSTLDLDNLVNSRRKKENLQNWMNEFGIEYRPEHNNTY